MRRRRSCWRRRGRRAGARWRNPRPSVSARLVPPFALKLIAPGILHKSDLGGLALALADTAAVAEARRAMLSSPALAGQKVAGFLVEEMAPKGYELVVGGFRDPRFGPVIMLGLGGIAGRLRLRRDRPGARAGGPARRGGTRPLRPDHDQRLWRRRHGELLVPRPVRPSERVVLFGNGGGASVLAADIFARRGFALAAFDQATRAALAALAQFERRWHREDVTQDFS